jgi:hypothetical protein
MDLRHRSLNFDPRQSAVRTRESGWYVDDFRQALPPEPPGLPSAGGSWEIARRLVRDYAFADPAIIRHAYRSGEPAVGRDMLLESHFCGLRFYLGVRVGGVIDDVLDDDRRPARVWVGITRRSKDISSAGRWIRRYASGSTRERWSSVSMPTPGGPEFRIPLSVSVTRCSAGTCS